MFLSCINHLENKDMDLLTFFNSFAAFICAASSPQITCLCPDSGCEGSIKKIEDIPPTWTLYTGPPDQGWGDSWHILRSMFRREIGDWDGITSEKGPPFPKAPLWSWLLVLVLLGPWCLPGPTSSPSPSSVTSPMHFFKNVFTFHCNVL